MAFFDDLAPLRSVLPENRPSVLNEQAPPESRPEDLQGLSTGQLSDMEARDMVIQRKRVAEEARQERRLKWDRCWQHFNQVYDATNKASWQQKTFQPVTTKVVEIITANLQGAMMAPDLPAEFQTKIQKYDQNIRCINDLMADDIDKCKFKAYWTDFIRTLGICGTAIGKIDYVKEEETVMVKERRPQNIMDRIMQSLGRNVQNERFNPTKMVVKDYARFRNVDLYDIYPQPGKPEVSKDMWIIESGKITNKELIEGMRDPDPYYRLDNVTEALLNEGSAKSIEEDPEKATRRQALLENNMPAHYLDPDKPHDLLEYWGPIPQWFINPEMRESDEGKYLTVPGWIWLVDGKYVVRKRVTPFRDGEPPYVKGTYIRVPNQFYGVGPAELIIGLQIEKNELRNTRVDNVNLILNKITAVLKDHVHDYSRLVSGPGAIWTFKGIDDIRKAFTPVEYPDITKDSYLASAEVDREIQETTGAVKATLGVGGADEEAGGGTFRGQLLNKQVATERFMLYARVLEMCGLADAFKKLYQRIYQYKSYDDAVAVLGEKKAQYFQFIAPEELEKISKLVPMGVMTMENKGVKLAQMQEFTKLWGPHPWFKGIEMARQMWVEMGFPDPDKVLFSDEEMQQFLDFKKQMLGQGAPVGGPPRPKPPGLVRPDGSPIAGGEPGPTQGLPREAIAASGPGANPIDVTGRPLS